MDSGLTRWSLNQVKYTDGKILDIGCGGGKTINVLSRRHPNSLISGIDYSITSIKTAINKNRKKVNEGKVEIKQASVSSMPYEDSYFKYITAIRT
ncbi:MAG: class I SAM-dependent methyltransferase, partial [Bacteroidota bacterium]|nr:class I SAM-dependent methyltransferase [Bacteroidota bacterium]